MLSRQVGHRASECPNKGKPTGFSPGKRACGTCALGCVVFDSQCFGATVEEIEQDQDEEDIEDFVAFSIRSLEGSPFLTVEPRRQFLDSRVSNQLQIDMRTPRLRRQMLASRSPAASSLKEISVNVVSNEPTPFLIGLDVLRGFGLVIDYHYNRVYSHILKRYFPCAILSAGHLAVEMLPSNSE